MQEEKISLNAHFITLTYDTKHVPISRNGFMELRKRDLQLFFKRLRKASPKSVSIKYYAAGEYGGKTLRPHYHIILFNVKLELIQPAWNLGHVHYGQLTAASVGYTLKYITKSWRPMHRNDDRQPQFALMSKKLGQNYLTPAMINWHKADLANRMYLNLPEGKKCTMPRYYKDKLFQAIFDDDIERYRMRSDIGIVARMKMLKEQDKKIKQKGFQQFEKERVANDQASFGKMEKSTRAINKNKL